MHDKLFLADTLKKYLNSRYIPWLHRQQRRIPLRLVIDGHVSVLTRAADAGDDAGEVGAGGGVGVLQAIKRGVLRLGAFVAVGAVAAVQVSAADERAGPQRPQQGQLLFNWRLFGMQAQAVDHEVATGLACSAQGLRQQRGIGER